MKFLFDFFFTKKDDDLNVGLKRYKELQNEPTVTLEAPEEKEPGFLSFAKNHF